MLLAIDTATRLMSLALHDGQALIAEQTWHTSNNHSTQLAPAVQALLEHNSTATDVLTALAVSVGPGSFTGLRVGIALAKGIASAHDLPLVGVTTLDTIAAAQSQYPDCGLIATVQAGRGRIIAGRYHWDQDQWKRHDEPQFMEWEILIESSDGNVVIAGEIDQRGLDLLTAAQGRGRPIHIVSAAHRLRRAGFLAEEAWKRLKNSDDSFDAALIAPLYLPTKDGP